MVSILLDRLGNWNPQLLRELKGRLKPRNVAITIALSCVSQFMIFGFAWLALPEDETLEAIEQNHHPTNIYCTGWTTSEFEPSLYSSPQPYWCELIPQTHHYAVNWQAWNADLFFQFSLIMPFALFVIGSYLLLSNLDKEQRRGTLDFIRLSPRSAANILGGQLMGAPILLYLAIALAIPLQLKTGLEAGLRMPELVGFFGLVGITSLTLYSIALLFGLISFGLGGFHVWLASGLIFSLEGVATKIGLQSPKELAAFNWLGLFAPLTSWRYLFPRLDIASPPPYYFGQHSLDFLGFALLVLVNGLLVIGWTWHALRRKFHNPAIPLIRRRDSYLLTFCFQGMILGFTMQPLTSIPSSGPPWTAELLPESRFTSVVIGLILGLKSSPIFLMDFDDYWPADDWTESAFTSVVLLNLVFFLILIVALSPAWQTLQGWSRYCQMGQAKSGRRGLLHDLILGEQSPPLAACGLNLAIAAACLMLWIILSPITNKALALWGLLACGGLLMVYACMSQVIMLTQLKRRGFWATVAMVTSFILPVVVLDVFSAVPKIGLLAPIVSPWFILIESNPTAIPPPAPNLFSVFSQWGMIALLTIFSTQQLRRLGQSASQRLFAGSEMMVR